MTHYEHILKLKLKYVPFNYPAIEWHMREGNRKACEREAYERLLRRDTYHDPIMSDA